jgi:hypothetical protein
MTSDRGLCQVPFILPSRPENKQQSLETLYNHLFWCGLCCDNPGLDTGRVMLLCCGVVYCTPDINRHRRSADSSVAGKCPKCRAALSSSGVVDLTPMLQRITSSLRVGCTSDECTWEGDGAGARAHARVCIHRTVRCKACDKQLPIGESMQHKYACTKGSVQCADCDAEMPRDKYDFHATTTCPKRLVDCASCGQSVPDEDKERHLADCDLVVVSCPVDGCPDSVERHDLACHLSQCAALEATENKISRGGGEAVSVESSGPRSGDGSGTGEGGGGRGDEPDHPSAWETTCSDTFCQCDKLIGDAARMMTLNLRTLDTRILSLVSLSFSRASRASLFCFGHCSCVLVEGACG